MSKKSNLRYTKKTKKKINNLLRKFIIKKLKNENIIIFNSNNKNQIEYENKQIHKFFSKLVDILNFSFEKEREHHITQGAYYPGYKHNINTIKNNIENRNFDTYILTSKKMEPISMLYVEKNEDDFDKIWTVCTNNKYRGKGMSSKLLNYMIVNQLNNPNQNRNDMLLEVYNDHIIGREDNDVKQSQIMGLFGSKGFINTNPLSLSEHSFNNLLANDGKQTKIMVFHPDKWLMKNRSEYRKLNKNAKLICLSKF